MNWINSLIIFLFSVIYLSFFVYQTKFHKLQRVEFHSVLILQSTSLLSNFLHRFPHDRVPLSEYTVRVGSIYIQLSRLGTMFNVFCRFWSSRCSLLLNWRQTVTRLVRYISSELVPTRSSPTLEILCRHTQGLSFEVLLSLVIILWSDFWNFHHA